MPARVVRALILMLITAFLISPSVLADDDMSDQDNDAALRFVDVEIEPDEPTAGSVATMSFRIEDPDGNPVSGLRASGLLRAPSTAQDVAPPPPTVTTIGRELSDPGSYEVAVALNQPGRWWIEIRVDDDSGDIARFDHFTIVDAIDDPAPATTSEPIFIRSGEWNTFYRVDPDTGGVVELPGEHLFDVGGRWWLAEVSIQERGSISSSYGGTWRLHVSIRDAISGNSLSTMNLGDVRANVYSGSQQEPAIATAITIAPDGSAAYIYWARQLGDGWISWVAEADPLTGEIRNEQVINGAIASNGFWAEISIRQDGQVLVTEQVVELASVSGYRLSLIDRDTMEISTQYRRTDAREDSLTHCMLAYPGPIGDVAGDEPVRYSLCAPPESNGSQSLVVWDPVTGEAEYSIDLEPIAGDHPGAVDGVASPDETSFYVVNTRSLRIAEIDLQTGELTRQRSLLPEEDDDPSTLDRFFDWVFGAAAPATAQASGSIEPSVAISPGGEYLYVVANPEDREPGVLVIELEQLEIINSLKTGEVVDGIIATSDERLVVIQRESDADGDAVTILDQDGRTRVTFTLPGEADVVGIRR